MASVDARDYFTHIPRPLNAQHDRHGRAPKPPVSFHHPASAERPHPLSRMSTHRVDSSTTNFAEVLHDDGGEDGLKKLDIDYFNTVLDVFRDQKQHHSPVVFDFMLLHEINIHHLEHLLIAEWDWLSTALLQYDDASKRRYFAERASMRLSEIQSLLHKYSVALRDFEDMRKRATLDEASNPLSHSSWHERLLNHDGSFGHPTSKLRPEPMSAFRRLSNAIQQVTISKDDPEKHPSRLGVSSEDPDATDRHPDESAKTKNKKKLFGASTPACRQLAGVEDWARERAERELSEQQRMKTLRDEKLATRFRRFSLAFFAGIALIGPMLLMTLVGNLKCSLATTSVAVLLFAMVVTGYTQVGERDIVVVTAGYAAVLVVFVGTQH